MTRLLELCLVEEVISWTLRASFVEGKAQLLTWESLDGSFNIIHDKLYIMKRKEKALKKNKLKKATDFAMSQRHRWVKFAVEIIILPWTLIQYFNFFEPKRATCPVIVNMHVVSALTDSRY